MGDFKLTIECFLNYFKGFELNILKKNNKVEEAEYGEHNHNSVEQSEAHLVKMLQSAKHDLSKAYKSHKAGKLSAEELFDYEWHVSDLEEHIKMLKDFNDDELI